mmetsp:Transcript_83425/g.239624  ORF Transcript_83425/g.239624 Transcript_83425/m.239624 type:complete len:474 (-) Transcript_83425:204-1625(-)
MSSLTEGRALNIACVSHAESGHMNPIMLIAEGLAERGHHVKLITQSFGAAKYEKKAQQFGATFVGLPVQLAESEIHNKAKGVPFMVIRDSMKPSLLAALKAAPPDVIVGDFTTLAAGEVAHELGVPFVTNVAGSLELIMTLLRFRHVDNMIGFGGFGLCWSPFRTEGMAAMLNLGNLGTLTKDMVESLAKGSLVLINSFFGLDDITTLPPFIKLVGPLAPASEGVDLSGTHPELYKFLSDARDVVYITTGTMVILEEWLVKVLFEAMKLAGCHVVWSLKEDCHKFIPSSDDPAFFISSWLPQPALLCHPKVKAVVTHCGWGGSIECTQGGKPVLALPFFSDQPCNAKMLLKSGMAEPLGPMPSFSVDHTGRGCYKPGSLNAQAMAKTVKKILEDEKYARAAQRVQSLSKGAGLGRTAVCEHIESAAIIGVKHLCNGDQVRAMTRHTPAVVSVALLAIAASVLAVVAKAKRASR